MRTRKRFLSTLLTLALLLSLLPTTALAVEDDVATVTTEAIIPDPDLLPNNDTLFAGYVEQTMYADLCGDISPFSTGEKTAGSQLTGNNKSIYDALKTEITKVAKGEETSTKFTVTISGTDFDFDKISSALLADCPYELYWYDKTNGVSYTSGTNSPSFIFSVASDYADLSVTETVKFPDETTKTYYCGTQSAITSATSAAVTNAKNVVTANASESDYKKLVAYKEYICAAVEYNHTAASNPSTPYGNPWQLIWVFDGDENTKVVCEGYAKAFQYLCDLTTLSENPFKSETIQCYTVTGTMNGGAHMWNIVTMDDDKNYLVDVTNCDEGAVGYPNILFLAGTSGSIGSGYTFTTTSPSIAYTYDSDTTSLYGTGAESILTLSTENYKIPITGLTVEDLTTPVTGDTPDADATVKASAADGATDKSVTVGSVKWYNGETELGSGTFAPSTTYTAKIAVTAPTGYRFTAGPFGDYTVTLPTEGDGTTATLSRTFPATGDKTITGLAISTSPTKTDYEHGDAFEKSGMVVTATYSDSTSSAISDYTVTYATESQTYLKKGDTKVIITAGGQTVEQTITVSAKTLTVTGLTAEGREYNGTTGVTLSGGTLSGIVEGESVTAEMPTSGTITDANAGSNKSVSISTITLSGENADNYTLTQPTVTVTITRKNISGATINLGTTPTYDGTEKTVAISSVVLSGGPTIGAGDYEIVTGTNKATNVEGKTLKITGTGNYTGEATTTWSLQKATPTVGDFTITALAAQDYTGSPISVTAPTAKKTGMGTVTVKYAGSETAPTNAGSYPVTFDVAGGTNYTATATSLEIGTLIINKVAYNGTKTASDTVRSGQVTTDKGLTLPALPDGAHYPASGTRGGTTPELISAHSISGTTLTYSTTSQSNDTSATITIPVSDATNYNLYNVTVTITAKDKDPAGVAIGEESVTTSYGTNITITATKSDSVSGGNWSWDYPTDTFEVDGAIGASIVLKPKKATTTAVTVTATYESDSHKGTDSISIIVNPKTLTANDLTFGDGTITKVYDGTTNTTATVSILDSAKVNSGDALPAVNGTYAYNSADVATANKVTFTSTETTSSNYVLPANLTKEKSASITPATLTVTGTGTASGTYGKKLGELTISGLTMKLNSAEVSGTWAFDAGDTIPPATGTPAYAVTFTPTTGAGNYNPVTDVTVTPTISKVDLAPLPSAETSVLINQAKTGVTYDLTTALNGIDGAAITGVAITSGANTDGVLTGTPSYSGKTVTFDVASIAAVNKTGKLDVTISSTNYKDFVLVLTVKTTDKQELTISGVTMDAPSSEYGNTVGYNKNNLTVTGATDPTFDTTTLEYIYSGTPLGGTFATGTIAPTQAGSYKLTVKVPDSNANYKGKLEIPFTIIKKNVTITGLTASDKEYDGNATANVSGTATVSGKVGSDDVTVTPGTATFDSKNVGTNKTVTFTGYSLSGTAAANYQLTDQPASVTAGITAKPVTVTGISAVSRAYENGNKEVTLIGTGTVDGIVTGDDMVVSLAGAKGTMATADAGDNKEITITGVTLTGTDAANYALTQPTGVTVTITKATWAATTATGSAKYGTTGSVDLSSYLAPGGTIGTITKTDGNSVISGTPAMTDKLLKFTFVDDSGKVGSTATITVPVTGATNYGNYDISVTVTVNAKQAQSSFKFTSATQSKTYGNADFTVTATGAETGSTVTYASSDTSVATVDNTGKVHIVKVGTATITATAAATDDYAQATASYTLTVNKATITITVGSKSAYVGDAVPTLSSSDYTVTGLASGDSLATAPTVAYASTPDMTKAGTVAIKASGAAVPTSGNYNDTITYVDGTLTISSRPYYGGGSSSSSNTTTTTTTNRDGSTTTTTTNKTTGTVTEVTKEKDGTTTTVETKKDGTVTETVKTVSGTTGTVVTDKNGDITKVTASVSSTDARNANKSGEAVTLPVEVPAVKTTGDAPAVEVTVSKSSGSVQVEIPVEKVTPGTVAVIVKADGTKEIVSTSVVTENGVALTLSGSTTVKIFDNAKSFTDVPATNVFYNEISSLSAREIMVGKTEEKFDLYSSVTLNQIANVAGRITGAVDVSNYNAGIVWGAENGLKTGNAAATRGDVLKALYIAAGSPAVADTSILSIFNDSTSIPADMAAIVAWAAQNGILKGTVDGKANLGVNVTRGQACALAGRAMVTLA